MNLYIETENGQVKNHPAFEDNLIQAFGSVPEHWVPFERVERPVLGMYEVMVSKDATYELIDGVWKDVWHKRDMTAEEREAKKQTKIKEAQDFWAALPQAENWSAWVLNKETFQHDPPIPRPEPDQAKLDAGIKTFWCGADNNWKDTPVRPEGQHTFDFLAWQWVEITP
jgi:hypothetical protein